MFETEKQEKAKHGTPGKNDIIRKELKTNSKYGSCSLSISPALMYFDVIGYLLAEI